MSNLIDVGFPRAALLPFMSAIGLATEDLTALERIMAMSAPSAEEQRETRAAADTAQASIRAAVAERRAAEALERGTTTRTQRQQPTPSPQRPAREDRQQHADIAPPAAPGQYTAAEDALYAQVTGTAPQQRLSDHEEALYATLCLPTPAATYPPEEEALYRIFYPTR
jgi:hypothetical protein